MKKSLMAVMALALCLGSAWAGDPPGIVFPKGPKVVPQPMPSILKAPTVVKKGQWYPISSDGPLLVEGYGNGEITISARKGPITVPAENALGWDPDADDPDFVTIPGPNIYLIKPSKSGPVLLRVQSAINKLTPDGKPIPFTQADVIRKDLMVQLDNKPVDPVDPDVPVDPEEGKSPFAGPGLRVLIVFNNKDINGLTKEQEEIVYSKEVRDFLDAACVKDGDQPEYRFFPKDTPVNGDSPVWQKAMALPRDSTPWVYVGNGKKGFSGKLSNNKEDFLKLVKKYQK